MTDHPASPAIALQKCIEGIEQLTDERRLLRSALVGLVGVDGRADLEQMEAFLRVTPAPAEDKAATIDAIHALLKTAND